MWHSNPLRELYTCAILAGGLLVALGVVAVYLISVELAQVILRGE